MAKRPKVCIDRVLPADRMRFQSTVRRGGTVRAIIPIGKLWMNGSTLRVHFLGGTIAQQAKAKQQAQWWTQFANLKFEFNNAPDAEIRVTFDSSDGAWSYVGTDNQGIPLSQPTMNLGFLDGGTAAHEFGHAIGLAHEHQNPAGGIEWNEAKVLQDLSGPPNNWTPAMIRHNVLNKYRVDQVKGTKFDPDSICSAACAQLNASIPNFFIHEIFDEFNEPWERDIVTRHTPVVNGYIEISHAPGLGIDLCLDEIAKHPYRQENAIPLFKKGWEKREGI
jgi:hypothetical protein